MMLSMSKKKHPCDRPVNPDHHGGRACLLCLLCLLFHHTRIHTSTRTITQYNTATYMSNHKA